MSISLVILQVAASTAGATAGPAPDIELRARVRAEQVKVIEAGEARLEVTADPALDQNVTITQVPSRNGSSRADRTIRDLEIRIKGSATLADPRTPDTAPFEPGVTASEKPSADQPN